MITVDTETGRDVVAHTATPITGKFTPNTRVENPKGFENPPVIKGFKIAYSRKSIKVLVYRCDTKGGGWLVYDARSDAYTLCKNTTVSQKLTVALRDAELVGRPLETLLSESAAMIAEAAAKSNRK